MSQFYNHEEINSGIKHILENEFSGNDGKKFGYLIINKKDLNDVSIINNHPEWFDLYLENNHQINDPVVMKALRRVESFDWDEEIGISSKPALTKVMHHARNYDINSGHTFIIHDYHNNLALLSIFDKYEMIAGERNPQNLSRQFSRFVKIHQKLLSLYEFFGKDNKYNRIKFSKRENEILYWAACGKTYKEIAAMLEITESAIKFHMAKIVQKLDATNAWHAIRLASDSNLISLPVS